MADASDGLVVVVSGDVAPLRSSLSEASRASSQFSKDLTTAFENAALKGKSLSDVLTSLAESLSSHAFEAALSPLTSAFGKSLTSLLGVSTSAASSTPSFFASGGVLNSPVAFPLGGGQTGVAGEAGAEAIMPLTRGSDGRLGVKTSGGGSPVNITFNVTAADAQSFTRSESQIAAMLNRVAARGARNL